MHFGVERAVKSLPAERRSLRDVTDQSGRNPARSPAVNKHESFQIPRRPSFDDKRPGAIIPAPINSYFTIFGVFRLPGDIDSRHSRRPCSGPTELQAVRCRKGVLTGNHSAIKFFCFSLIRIRSRGRLRLGTGDHSEGTGCAICDVHFARRYATIRRLGGRQKDLIAEKWRHPNDSITWPLPFAPMCEEKFHG